MGKIKTAAYALVALVVLSACLGAVDDDDTDTNVEENGEAEAQAAEEEETDGAGDEQTDENDESKETNNKVDTDEESDSGDESADTVEETDGQDADEANQEAADAEDEADAEQETLQAAGPLVLESTLVDMGIDVRTVEERGDTLYVEYVGYEATQEAIARDIGTVAGAYAGITGEGYESDRMEVTLRTADGSVAGTYHVESEWAAAYYNEELTDEEYAQLVLETIDA